MSTRCRGAQSSVYLWGVGEMVLATVKKGKPSSVRRSRRPSSSGNARLGAAKTARSNCTPYILDACCLGSHVCRSLFMAALPHANGGPRAATCVSLESFLISMRVPLLFSCPAPYLAASALQYSPSGLHQFNVAIRGWGARHASPYANAEHVEDRPSLVHVSPPQSQ